MVRAPAAILTATCMLAIAAVPALAGPLPDAASGGNGYVMMIHGPVEPSPTAPLGAPPAEQAVLTTNDDGNVTFFAIPYRTDTVRPAVVEDASLGVRDPAGLSVMMTTPEEELQDHPICKEETSIETHEGNFSGPTEACKPFVFDAGAFHGLDTVTLEFAFEDADGSQLERYNLGAHLLLHFYMEGASPVTPAEADENLDESTPFLVESAVDPQP